MHLHKKRLHSRIIHHSERVEGIEIKELITFDQPQQEMRGKSSAIDSPTPRPGNMNAQNPKRHRQSFAPINHLQKIGVVPIVVGFAVASIAIGLIHHLAKPNNQTCSLYRCSAKILKVSVIGLALHLGQIQPRQQ